MPISVPGISTEPASTGASGRFPMPTRAQGGFTLLELLVSMTILAIIMVVVVLIIVFAIRWVVRTARGKAGEE